MLQLQNVSIALDGQPIINDISWQLNEGQILAIVGESGVGKTTLIKAIAGIVDFQGTILFDRQQVIGSSQRLVPGVEGVATVFQDYQLMHHRTVYDNIAYPLRAYPAQEQHRHTEYLLDLLMLNTHKAYHTHQLSGGQKQQVAIARALAQQPQLLLMDEPFSNMDSARTQVIKSSIFDYINQEKITAILITHHPSDALALSDQIAVIQDGKIAQLAPPKTIFDHPVSEYVLGCFGQYNYWDASDFALDFPTISLPNKHTKYAIRIEDIFLSTTGTGICPLKIRRSSYQGSHYLIAGQTSSSKEIYFYHHKKIQIGKKVYCDIDQNKLKTFV